MRYSQPSYFLPVLAAFVLLSPFEATAERLPLTPHTAKLEVSDPEFTITTDASGDYVIGYQGEKKKPVKVVFMPPNKVRLTLAATVTSDAQGNFTYRYELATAAGSPPATTLVVEYQGAVFGVASPSGWGGDAVSFLPAIAWRPAGENPGLSGASRLGGFALSASVQPVSEKFTSTGKEGFFHFQGSLPGIVDCHAGGKKSLLAYPDEPPGGISDHLPRFPYQGVGGRTVGPVVMPRDGQIPWLLERLRSYAQESHQLGWLDDPARLQKYLQVLDQVGRQVEAKSYLLAQEMLDAFRRQAELDFKAGALTSESYALFLHNSTFLGQLLSKAS